MDDTQRRIACDLLWEHWHRGTRVDQLPEEVRPASREEGYAIQALVEERSAFPLFGWKIAATSRAGQTHIAVDGPLAGRLLRERVRPSGASVHIGPHMRVVEAEFAFRMAEDLEPRPAPYTVDDVLARVASLHPAIEVPDSRYDDFTIVGAAQLIADNACAHYFVPGDAAPEHWRQRDLAAHVVIGRVGDRLEREGRGANVLGDPRVALTWLVNELSALGITLRRDEIVTTGTCLVPPEVVPGDHFVADFGDLGRVDAHITA